ncbi:hypothetical protein HII13_004344 [Brettanomyces bruxellensis]|nr:hypothetical protein HII13_004344 [Brettanomyces bruxellensis]
MGGGRNYPSQGNNSSLFRRATSVSSSAIKSDQESELSYTSSKNDSSSNLQRSYENGSQESLSLISKSLTATSVHSTVTSNISFDSKWLPESEVVQPERYRLQLQLTREEIDLLRWSWRLVTVDDDSTSLGGNTFNAADFSSYLFCIQFYNNFISMDEKVVEMIPSIRHQASSFADVLNQAIGTLEDLSKMQELLTNLGKLHARILGIERSYFKTMGEALIKTFRDWFGNNETFFPLILEEAWIKLYCFLANSIIQGGIDPFISYNTNDASIDSFSTQQADDVASIASSIQSKPFLHTNMSKIYLKPRRKPVPQKKELPATPENAISPPEASPKKGRRRGLHSKRTMAIASSCEILYLVLPYLG